MSNIINPHRFAAAEVTRQSDILHWWKLDEGTGDVAYDSIATNSVDLAKSGGALWATGRNGSSLSLDGTGDYYHNENAMTAHSGSYAITCWCYPTLAGLNFRPIVALADQTGTLSNQKGHWISFESTSEFCYRHDKSSSSWTAIAEAAGDPGEPRAIDRWYFLCATWDVAGTMDFYLADASGADGSSPDSVVTDVGTAAPSGQHTGLDSWIIGQGYGSKDFGGQVDDVRFYGAYLSESDANAIYNGGIGDFV